MLHISDQNVCHLVRVKIIDASQHIGFHSVKQVVIGNTEMCFEYLMQICASQFDKLVFEHYLFCKYV